MGNSKSRTDTIDPVRYVITQDASTQVFLLADGSVMICRNGNQIVHYSPRHTVTRRIRKKYHFVQK
jgi:hypothetical protein